jgi:uncharacterized Fe-S cluster-containing MiaB family protein
VEIGVGIETLNEKIRNVSIHKGVSTEDIKSAIETAIKIIYPRIKQQETSNKTG